MKRIFFNPPMMLLIGATAGAAARFLDDTNFMLDDMASRIMVWVAACTFIALMAEGVKQAAALVACFCVTMVPAYYGMWYFLAHFFGTEEPPLILVIGWGIAAVLSPLFGILGFKTRYSGIYPFMLRPLIIAVPLAVTLIMFGAPNISDYVFTTALVYMLFIKKLGRVYTP